MSNYEFCGICHSTKGSANKAYIVLVSGCGANKYAVHSIWGRVGKPTQSQQKGCNLSKGGAMQLARSILDAKLNRGYVFVDDPAYTGGLSMESRWIREAISSIVRIDGGFDSEAVCCSNVGLEASFDEGVSYVFQIHPDSKLLLVFDRNGLPVECLKSRFEV